MPGGGPGGGPGGDPGTPGGGPGGGPGGEGAGGPGGGPGGAGAAASGEPHAWQKEFPSGFWAPHRAQIIATYVRDAAGLRARFTDVGAAVRAMPQFGQKPDATMCMWQFGHTVSAKPMCAASSRRAWCSR